MKIELPDKVDFTKAKVGDRVYSLNNGEGVIDVIDEVGTYPILAKFITPNLVRVEQFTVFGRSPYDLNGKPTLFYLADNGDIVTERPVRMVEKVLARGEFEKGISPKSISINLISRGPGADIITYEIMGKVPE